MTSLVEQSIITEITANGVATLWMNRPQIHNAFDSNMIMALYSTLKQLAENPAVRIVIIKGKGKSFSAGADLNWMRQMVGYSKHENLQDAKAFSALMYLLYTYKKPTIAVVQGAAYGGGAGIVACCHIAIASTEAKFCFAEAKFGLVPSVISPYIVNALGFRNARAHFLSAAPFDAETALRLGLCQEVVSFEFLDHCLEKWSHRLLQNGPRALEQINELLLHLQPLPVTAEMRDRTAQLIADLRVSKEGQEGLSAYIDKRNPSWRK